MRPVQGRATGWELRRTRPAEPPGPGAGQIKSLSLQQSPILRRKVRANWSPSLDTFTVMDLLEVEVDRNRVVAFDGRVLEVFGGTVRRFHVKLLAVTVSGPDKKGNRDVTLTQAGINHSLPLDEAAFERFQPLFDSLKSAGVNVAV